MEVNSKTLTSLEWADLKTLYQIKILMALTKTNLHLTTMEVAIMPSILHNLLSKVTLKSQLHLISSTELLLCLKQTPLFRII